MRPFLDDNARDKHGSTATRWPTPASTRASGANAARRYTDYFDVATDPLARG